MKRFKILIALLVFLCVGCATDNEQKIMECTMHTNDVVNGYTLDSTYTVYYKGEVANKTESTETVTSDDEEILSYMIDYLENTYSIYEETYGGYNYEITSTDDSVEANVVIDYEIMDLDKYIIDQPALKSYMTDDNQLTVEGLKKTYELLGATCEDQK